MRRKNSEILLENSMFLTAIMMIVAYCISVFLRFYWVYWASSYPHFFYNNELMISTNDGYAFAEGARDMIAGFHQPNDLSYYGSSLSTLSVFLVKILPFSFETIILYMSVFISSLIVIPIMLIAYEFKNLYAGFIASLVASVANSYYNRTMAGYYDTDMLNITLAMFVLWALIRLVTSKDRLCLLYIPAFILIYSWWYPSSFSLNSAMLIAFLGYTIVFDRKSRINYEAMILMLISLTNIALSLQIVLILICFFIIYFKSDLINLKRLAILGGIIFLFFIIRGGLNPILFQLKFYIFRSVADTKDIAFKFFNVNQTIMESSTISSDIFMKRVSSSITIFIFGLIGYFYLCFKQRAFLLSLPILALGVLAFKAGLRFTIYAVPIIALGYGVFIKQIYILFMLWLRSTSFKKNKTKVLKILQYPKTLTALFFIFFGIISLIPSIRHIIMYKTHPVFFTSEVEILNSLKKIAKREDYVISWWDYGYPIRYYSDVKTLIDGGKHLGGDNFPVSFTLTADEVASANMARLEVEYTEMQYAKKIPFMDTHLKWMMKDYGFNNVNLFLKALNSPNFKAPKPSRDIYYYLPDRMIDIFNVIAEFSNLDLKDGKPYNNFFFFTTQNYQQDGKNGPILLSENLTLSEDLTYINYNGRQIDINTIYTTQYDKNGKLNVEARPIDDNAPLYLIFMSDYARFVIVNKKAFDSTYVQLYVLENYDKNLFEPVVLNPVAKIYKLKR